MGLVLSIPSIIGSSLTGIVGIGSSFIVTSLLSLTNYIQSTVGAIISYAVLYLLNSLLSWCMLSSWFNNKLSKLSAGYLQFDCQNDGKCYSVFAVHRLSFALVMFHCLFAFILSLCNSQSTVSAKIQNSLWPFKIVLWIILVTTSFLIPTSFISFWGNVLSVIGSALFIVYGLLLLIDFAHTWAEKCVERVLVTDSTSSKFSLIGSTVGMYLVALVLTILAYVYFCASSCSFNQAINTINLLLCIAVSCISVHPIVQEYNPRSGLAQASMVACYTCYLILSALANRPDEEKCNPWSGSATGTREFSKVIGAAFTFLTIVYSALRAVSGSDKDEGYEYVYGDAHNLSRERSLEPSLDNDDVVSNSYSDYNYIWFHVIFILAACYTGSLLTNWNTMNIYENKENDVFVRIGFSYAAVWVKIITSWICHLLYAWTCLAPIFFPYRFMI
ncbi:sphingolipid biosynthesis protein [Schizosaccharomyces cryophilus OY26]|uniref:Sphingolipid biosynthesis protein n=1 Tax=Schizosaccharomyces cryophilus (strain OY26 / ATCC MYA-4695 / CBS 11777 / NBRC 106824 / NRRL Y48691) TaxID=653667 RepID=S9XGI0_SCHCR|nr:sphingolipid biosynthesis protein [Schizosaccharomyces cryophilus OY26]EPY52796.1 sphingolipid biosynthesis protein [Schizosaccharomyces cryophilus OY26]